jgi:hypothetical protein
MGLPDITPGTKTAMEGGSPDAALPEDASSCFAQPKTRRSNSRMLKTTRPLPKLIPLNLLSLDINRIEPPHGPGKKIPRTIQGFTSEHERPEHQFPAGFSSIRTIPSAPEFHRLGLI